MIAAIPLSAAAVCVFLAAREPGLAALFALYLAYELVRALR